MKPSDLGLRIDRSASLPIYRQIVRQIREQVREGRLRAGELLPPERQLADALGVNRTTVLNAYAALKRQGLVSAHVGRGTLVLPMPGAAGAQGSALHWGQLFSEASARDPNPVIRDLLEISEREGIISLSIGLPCPRLLPLELYEGVTAAVAREIGAPALLHGPTEGITPLREGLAAWLGRRGVDCTASNVLVLSGSQQGLDLVARAFLDPGDAVIVEEPSYFGAMQTFRSAQARLVGVPCDEDGLRTDLLAQLLERQRPKLIYTLPTFQNPSGRVMSLERRRELLALAARHRVPILEDDPYGELRYDGESLPSLKALDEQGTVLYLSTMSKMLFPGLRVGWLVAPPEVVQRLTLVKQTVDLQCNTPGQWVLERFLSAGHLDEHVETLRRAYTRKRDVMHEVLTREAPEGTQWRKPQGGFYVWCRLPEDVERSRLIALAAEQGVSFLPGWICYVHDPGASDLRLNFTYATEDEIAQGVQRLMQSARASRGAGRARSLSAIGTPPIV